MTSCIARTHAAQTGNPTTSSQTVLSLVSVNPRGHDVDMYRVGACLLFFAMATACGSPTMKTSTGPPRSSTTIAPQPMAVRIKLSSRAIAAGATMTGDLVVRNNTGAPIHLLTAPPPPPALPVRCTPKWQVLLGNDEVQPSPGWLLNCGTKPLVIATGENRLPFVLRASYNHCGGIGPAGPMLPACLAPPAVAPPLPPGDYNAMFFADDPVLPQPAPVPVHVATP
jgi:hypothetical protein